MIVAEVKEGRADLNRGARDPRVLEAALVRFGCCDPQVGERVVEELLRHAQVSDPALGFLALLERAGERGDER